LLDKEKERKDLQTKLSPPEQSAAQYRNEINFWNGKYLRAYLWYIMVSNQLEGYI
jgi:hypothetical protein